MQAVEQVPTWFASTDRPLEQQAQLKATASLLRTQHALGNANGAENSCQMALTLIHEGDISLEQGGLSAAAVAAAYNQAASLGLAQVSRDQRHSGA